MERPLGSEGTRRTVPILRPEQDWGLGWEGGPPASGLRVPSPQEESQHIHILFLLLSPHSWAEKGLRREAISSQGSRWNAGSLGTGPAVPGKARLWESHPQPPPQDGPPDARDPSSPPGGFVRVEPPPHPSKPQPGWTPEFSRPAVTRSPLPRPRLSSLLQHNSRHCAAHPLPAPLLWTPVQWGLCRLQYSGWR